MPCIHPTFDSKLSQGVRNVVSSVDSDQLDSYETSPVFHPH